MRVWKKLIERREKKLWKVLIKFRLKLRNISSTCSAALKRKWNAVSITVKKVLSGRFARLFLWSLPRRCDDIPLHIIPGINSFDMRWRIENTHERWCKVLLVSSHNSRSMIPFIEWFSKKSFNEKLFNLFSSAQSVPGRADQVDKFIKRSENISLCSPSACVVNGHPP